MKTKRSLLLLISAIFGVAYAIYIIAYFFGIGTKSSGVLEEIGVAIATMAVTPHMICVTLAAIFNVVGFVKNGRGFTLTGAILYAVGGVVFLPYLMFVLPSMILSFVGFAMLKGIIEKNKNLCKDSSVN